jgi:hypothetical protein
MNNYLGVFDSACFDAFYMLCRDIQMSHLNSDLKDLAAGQVSNCTKDKVMNLTY